MIGQLYIKSAVFKYVISGTLGTQQVRANLFKRKLHL